MRHDGGAPRADRRRGPRHSRRRSLGSYGLTGSAARAIVAAVAIAGALVCPALADEMWGSSLGVPDNSLASRLSTAETADEFWDVTAWFDSGERFFARFLVTNQGPGDKNAAAVGHFIAADGTVLPFRWGRRDGEWILERAGRRVGIGKATLDVSESPIAVRIDSKKHGLDLALTLDEGNGVEGFREGRPTETFGIALPGPARATLNGDDPSKARTLVGTAAIVHRWSDRPESETVRRRDEIFARRGDVAIYVGATTWSDGTRRTTYDLRRGPQDDSASPPAALDHGSDLMPGSDGGYPIARTWSTNLVPGRDLTATLERVLLRMNPLDVLPQPFRFILALGGTPQRVWADAEVRLSHGDDVVEMTGIATTSFARPER